MGKKDSRPMSRKAEGIDLSPLIAGLFAVAMLAIIPSLLGALGVVRANMTMSDVQPLDARVLEVRVKV